MTPPPLSRSGELMLSALPMPQFEGATAAGFKANIDHRPDINLSDAECLTGLEALQAAGLADSYEVEEVVRHNEDGEPIMGMVTRWRMTTLGHEALTAPGAEEEVDPAKPVEGVFLDLQPGIAITGAEAIG